MAVVTGIESNLKVQTRILFDIYKKEGEEFFQNGDIKKALQSYNLAVDLIPFEKETRVKRSKCYLKLGKLKKAMAEVEYILNSNSNHIEALLQKAEILYKMGNHEMALLFFHKGCKLQPNRKAFKDGIEKSQNAIDSKLGKNGLKVMTPVGDLTLFLPRKKDVHRLKEDRDRKIASDITASNSPLPSAGFPNRVNCQLQRIHRKRPPEPRDSSKVSTTTSLWSIPSTVSEFKIPEEKVVRYILGHLYEDKKYLEKLNLNLRFIDTSIVDKVDDGLGFLFDRVMFWRRLGPLPPPPPTRRHGSYLDILRKRREEFVDREKRKMRDIGILIDDRTKSFLDRFNSVESLPKHDVMRSDLSRNIRGRVLLPSITNENEPSPRHAARRKRRKQKPKEVESPRPPPLTFKFNSLKEEEPEIPVQAYSHRTAYFDEEDEHIEDYRMSYRENFEEGPIEEDEVVENEKAIIENYIARELDKLEGAFTFRRYEKAIHMAEALLRQVEEYPANNMKNKAEVLAIIHSFLGNAAFELEDYDKAIYHHQIDIDLGEEFRMEESLSRGYGNLGRVYVLQKKYRKALELFAKKAPLCNTPLETAWLFNEIGNLFIAMRAYVYARDSAQRAYESAVEASNQTFQFHSCSLLAIAEAKLKNNKAAKSDFEKALRLAEAENDLKAAEAIKQAMQTINMKLVKESKIKDKPKREDKDKKVDDITQSEKHTNAMNVKIGRGAKKLDKIKWNRQNISSVLQKPRNPGMTREKTVSDRTLPSGQLLASGQRKVVNNQRKIEHGTNAHSEEHIGHYNVRLILKSRKDTRATPPTEPKKRASGNNVGNAQENDFAVQPSAALHTTKDNSVQESKVPQPPTDSTNFAPKTGTSTPVDRVNTPQTLVQTNTPLNIDRPNTRTGHVASRSNSGANTDRVSQVSGH